MTGIMNPIHLAFIAMIALIFLGPKRLPELAKTLGTGLKEFRETMSLDAAPDAPAAFTPSATPVTATVAAPVAPLAPPLATPPLAPVPPLAPPVAMRPVAPVPPLAPAVTVLRPRDVVPEPHTPDAA
jgi:sec-independent protein translocase protein TatA